MTKKSNPIKHVEFSPTDYYQPQVNRGGKSTPLKEVTEEFRSNLISSLDEVNQLLHVGKKTIGLDVCTAIVELESNATAKSHRPTDVFNDFTCPFFGDVGYGRLLIQVSSQGIIELKKKIQNTYTKSGIKALSAVKRITQYEAPVTKSQDRNSALIVRLFRFSDPALNEAIDTNFELILRELGCDWQKHRSR